MLATLLVAALSQAAPMPEPDLSWMAGYWLDCAGRREASETWSDPRGGLSVGHAVTVENGRVSFEVSHIRRTPQGVAYVAQPGGASPTVFVLTESGNQRVVFANAENDFPTRIIYAREGDTLTATIEGQIGGDERTMGWIFKAAPLNSRCPA